MRISRVELTNIKSYVQASIDLRAGVTAIRGHNGAGKSTLLEAIGWALFDYLPYTQKQFVREGENTGKVTVSFISPLDSREYQVTRRCGSRADWSIFDPELGVRIDSNTDVVDFLRRHMRIEGKIELKELFTSALGAPQGTLTADFLATPANRKKKFDALLQVEDYGKAASNLSATATHLKEQIARQEERIAALEREAANLEGWRQAHEERREVQRATALRLDALEGEIEQVEALLARLQLAQTEVARSEGVARVAEATHAAARQTLEQAQRLLAESQAAAQTLAETRADHETHLRAERERTQAQQRVQQRDDLQAQRAEATSQRERASSDVDAASARLNGVAQAERRIVELQGPLARQGELEAARDRARQDVIRLGDTQRALAKQRGQRAAIERALADREREAADIEARRPLAAELETRRRRVEDLQAVAATRQQHEQRRAAIDRERAEVATRREKARQEHARQQQNLRKLEGYRSLAEGLAAREREQQAADEAARAIEMRLQQNRTARELSGAGNCPFLREPCKNIQQRGENSLGAYFDRLIATDERALEPARAKREAATAELAKARKAAEYYARLDDYRAQLALAESSLAECDTAEARLAAELRDIAQALNTAGDLAGLEEAQRLLRASQEADKRLATLPSVQRTLDEQRAQLGEIAEEVARLEATQAELASAPEAVRTAEAELARLGDPRGEAAGQRIVAESRHEVEQLLAEAQARLAEREAEVARLNEALAPFATLNQELAALDAAIQQARPGHTRYLQHERAAGQMAEREREQAAAAEREQATAAEARAAAQALAEATTRANDLRSQRGQLRETQRHTGEALAELERLIAQGEETLLALERARVERSELGASQQMLEQFRNTLREAGPLVTKRLLSQISGQANAIFGEIIGDRSAELAWVDDYEVTLTRGANRRTFAQLSGGEQMAAALATRLALLRRLTGLDLAFFDEPTQNMDSERRSALAEQIRRVRGFEQLIVISHDDTFEQGLDSVIHLEKRDGATVVRDDESSFAVATPFTGADAEAIGALLGADLSAFAVE